MNFELAQKHHSVAEQYYLSSIRFYLPRKMVMVNDNRLFFQANTSVRRFTKPVESLERSLEISRQRGRKRAQKRPNYKNVGEEEEEEKAPEDGQEDPEKPKGTEASSKSSRTCGDTEGECTR